MSPVKLAFLYERIPVPSNCMENKRELVYSLKTTLQNGSPEAISPRKLASFRHLMATFDEKLIELMPKFCNVCRTRWRRTIPSVTLTSKLSNKSTMTSKLSNNSKITKVQIWSKYHGNILKYHLCSFKCIPSPNKAILWTQKNWVEISDWDNCEVDDST